MTIIHGVLVKNFNFHQLTILVERRCITRIHRRCIYSPKTIRRALQAQSRYGDLLTQVQINELLKKEIAQVLEQRFGVSAEGQTASIDSYAQTYFDRRAWV
jgi:hypothetical protein